MAAITTEHSLEAEVEQGHGDKASDSGGYNALCISGGGAKGYLAIGAIHYAIDRCLMHEIKTFVGTSIGAVLCYFLIIGYTPQELMSYLCTHQTHEKIPSINLLNIVNNEGATTLAHVVQEWEKMTLSKIHTLVTLKGLRDLTGCDLVVVTYNLTANSVAYLSADTHPDLPCLSALQMSSSVPLLFPKYAYKGSEYVDGGVANNFPIDAPQLEGKRTLALYIERTLDQPQSDETFVAYVHHLFRITMVAIDQARIAERQHPMCTVINLRNEKKIGFWSFQLSTAAKLNLFSDGYRCITRFFEPVHSIPTSAVTDKEASQS